MSLQSALKLLFKYASAFEGNCKECGTTLNPGTASPYSDVCTKCEDKVWSKKMLGEEVKEKPVEIEKSTVGLNKLSADDVYLRANLAKERCVPYLLEDWSGAVYKTFSLFPPYEVVNIPKNWNPSSVKKLKETLTNIDDHTAEHIYENALMSGITVGKELGINYFPKLKITKDKLSTYVDVITEDPINVLYGFEILNKSLDTSKDTTQLVKENKIPNWFVQYCSVVFGEHNIAELIKGVE